MKQIAVVSLSLLLIITNSCTLTLKAESKKSECKAWLVQSIPTNMPHLSLVPGVLSTGTISFFLRCFHLILPAKLLAVWLLQTWKQSNVKRLEEENKIRNDNFTDKLCMSVSHGVRNFIMHERYLYMDKAIYFYKKFKKLHFSL